MNKTDNPQAFPPMHASLPGMTLRDWFAGQALAGLSRAESERLLESRPESFAAASYMLADAMLSERAKQEGR